MLEFIFYTSLFAIFYTYFGYPLLLFILSLFVSNDIERKSITPSVTLIISAYNEETFIRKKIENSLSLDYPSDRLEIMAISDCSTDMTNDIVLEYKHKGIILLKTAFRCGKSAGLNEAIAQSKGEIIVFSDANSLYPNDTLRKITRNFFDNKVGLVTGTTRYVSEKKGGMIYTTSSYTKLEHFIKIKESKVASCVGADGAIFAIRKLLHKHLSDTDINDFVTPLNVIKQGYRAVIDDEIFCTEATIQNQTKEFKRQVRITCRTLRAIFINSKFLNPFHYPLFSLELISHKLLKYLVPFLLILLFSSNFLLITTHELYKITMLLQLLMFSIALFTYLKGDILKRLPYISIISYFAIINMAFLVGWIKYVSGETYITWEHKRIS